MLGDNTCYEKTKQARRDRDKGPVEQRPEGMRHGLCGYLGEEPSRWNSKCKGLDAGACLPCLWNSKKVIVRSRHGEG